MNEWHNNVEYLTRFNFIVCVRNNLLKRCCMCTVLSFLLIWIFLFFQLESLATPVKYAHIK